MGVRAPTGAAEMQDRAEPTTDYYTYEHLTGMPRFPFARAEAARHHASGRVDRDYVLGQTGERAMTPAEQREDYFRRHPEARAIYEATQNRIRVRDRGGRFRENYAKRRRTGAA